MRAGARVKRRGFLQPTVHNEQSKYVDLLKRGAPLTHVWFAGECLHPSTLQGPVWEASARAGEVIASHQGGTSESKRSHTNGLKRHRNIWWVPKSTDSLAPRVLRSGASLICPTPPHNLSFLIFTKLPWKEALLRRDRSRAYCHPAHNPTRREHSTETSTTPSPLPCTDVNLVFFH